MSAVRDKVDHVVVQLGHHLVECGEPGPVCSCELCYQYWAPRPCPGSPVRPRVCPDATDRADKARLPEPISLRSPLSKKCPKFIRNCR
jgi:hypothetical protein